MKKVVLPLFCMLWLSVAYAQDSENRVSFGFGSSMTDFAAANGGSFLNTYNWNPIGRISVGRYLNQHLNLHASAALGPVTRFAKGRGNDLTLITADVLAQYKLFGSWTDQEHTRLRPYVEAGAGIGALPQLTDNIYTAKTTAMGIFGIGLNVRLTDDLSAQYGLAYNTPLAGATDGFIQHKIGFVHAFYVPKRDLDNDGVPNRKDKCPEIPGVLALNGCPDADGDGITDAEDKCPDVAGVLRMKGCPDADNDGITDAEDECPNAAGWARAKGCPDTDEDGVSDQHDECPDVPGLVELKGCTDADKDGVADKNDACPDIAGTANGCPDTDKDGIADKDDACPNIAGTANGCPDTDKDGIADKEDKCPDTAGNAANGGCPETPVAQNPTNPNTGNNNATQGNKPNTSGSTAATDKPTTETRQKPVSANPRFAKAAVYQTQNVQFKLNSADLTDASFAVLDDIAAQLQKEPNSIVQIEGYTDDTGSEPYNLKLAERRARNVQQYLIDKGVAKSRLEVVSYGEEFPAYPNDSDDNRQLNRRVVVLLLK